MSTNQTPILLSLRRLRDDLVAYEPKTAVAEPATLPKDRHDAITQLTNAATACEEIRKQSSERAMQIKRVRNELREGKMKLIVGMSRTM